MSMASDRDVVVVESTNTAPADTKSYVDWPAIIAGIVIASAISILLLTFGSAIGLSFVDFRARDGVDPLWIAIAAALWLLWVQVSSFMAGGYATGRLRRRHHDATEDESDVRDGAHGLLVWAGALVVGAMIAASGAASIVSGLGAAAATATNAAANIADDAAEGFDPSAYYADWLLRPAGTPAGAGAAPAGDTTVVRTEAGRILAQGAITGTVTDTDRAYLGQLVATNTALSQEEADARVNEVMTAVEAARVEAEEAAETARRTTVVGAFLTAAALLVSAVGAFWAAQKGGNHRDRNTQFQTVFRRF